MPPVSPPATPARQGPRPRPHLAQPPWAPRASQSPRTQHVWPHGTNAWHRLPASICDKGPAP
eukprot:9449452-Lingulodinium_polyedra.AAC.1